MMRLLKFILFTVTIANFFHPDSAQAQLDTACARLTVITNIDSAVIFVDSSYAGLTPLSKYCLTPGTHVVCAYRRSDRSWFQKPACAIVVSASDTTFIVSLTLSRVVQVMSSPSGAAVVSGDSTLGITPYFFSTTAQSGIIVVGKPGYKSMTLPFDSTTSTLQASLIPTTGSIELSESTYLATNTSKDFLPVLLSASSAVVTGVAAAYYKIRADNLYADYQRNRDAATLDRVQRLDLVSGIALGASQLSLALLTYFLLSQ